MPDLRADQIQAGPGHRNRTLALWATLALVVAAPLGVSVWDSLHEPGVMAPDFALTSTGYENGTLGDPVQFNLTDYRGKTVLLDFMAVLCTSCRVVTEEVLRPIHAEFGNRSDFVILSIDTWADPGSGGFGGETRSALIGQQQEDGVPWRHALDTDEVYLKYSAISLPKLVVVDPTGQIVLEKTGIPPLADIRGAVVDSLAGDAQPVNVLRVGLLGLAVVAGIASFFSPCSVGLIPAYMGILLQGTGRRRAGPGSSREGVGHTLRAGLVTAAGIVSVYGGLALLFWGLDLAGYGPAMRAALPRIAPVVAVLLILLGILMFFQVSWDRVARRLGMGRIDGRRGFYAFGVGYGLAAFGCTGPIFLPVLLAGFLEGAGTGLLVFLLYALAIASLVVAAAALVASGQQSRLRVLLENTRWVTRASALLLVGAGLYLLWFDVTAGVL